MSIKLERITESEYQKKLNSGELGEEIKYNDDEQIPGQTMFAEGDQIKLLEQQARKRQAKERANNVDEKELRRKTFILTLDLIQAIKRMVANEGFDTGENEFFREFLYEHIPDKYLTKY